MGQFLRNAGGRTLDVMTTSKIVPGANKARRHVDDALVETRLASPVAARAVLDSATQLVGAMPTDLAVEPDVYVGLQQLACEVETTIGAADSARDQHDGPVSAGDD
jgi:hypothetical protein